MLFAFLRLVRGIDRHARLFTVLALALVLAAASVTLLLLHGGSLLHILLDDILTLIFASLLITLGATLLLDLAYRYEERE